MARHRRLLYVSVILLALLIEGGVTEAYILIKKTIPVNYIQAPTGTGVIAMDAGTDGKTVAIVTNKDNLWHVLISSDSGNHFKVLAGPWNRDTGTKRDPRLSFSPDDGALVFTYNAYGGPGYPLPGNAKAYLTHPPFNNWMAASLPKFWVQGICCQPGAREFTIYGNLFDIVDLTNGVNGYTGKLSYTWPRAYSLPFSSRQGDELKQFATVLGDFTLQRNYSSNNFRNLFQDIEYNIDGKQVMFETQDSVYRGTDLTHARAICPRAMYRLPVYNEDLYTFTSGSNMYIGLDGSGLSIYVRGIATVYAGAGTNNTYFEGGSRQAFMKAIVKFNPDDTSLIYGKRLDLYTPVSFGTTILYARDTMAVYFDNDAPGKIFIAANRALKADSVTGADKINSVKFCSGGIKYLLLDNGKTGTSFLARSVGKGWDILPVFYTSLDGAPVDDKVTRAISAGLLSGILFCLGALAGVLFRMRRLKQELHDLVNEKPNILSILSDQPL